MPPPQKKKKVWGAAGAQVLRYHLTPSLLTSLGRYSPNPAKKNSLIFFVMSNYFCN